MTKIVFREKLFEFTLADGGWHDARQQEAECVHTLRAHVHPAFLANLEPGEFQGVSDPKNALRRSLVCVRVVPGLVPAQ